MAPKSTGSGDRGSAARSGAACPAALRLRTESPGTSPRPQGSSRVRAEQASLYDRVGCAGDIAPYRYRAAIRSASGYGSGALRLVSTTTVSRSAGQRTITLRKPMVSPECQSAPALPPLPIRQP